MFGVNAPKFPTGRFVRTRLLIKLVLRRILSYAWYISPASTWPKIVVPKNRHRVTVRRRELLPSGPDYDCKWPFFSWTFVSLHNILLTRSIELQHVLCWAAIAAKSAAHPNTHWAILAPCLINANISPKIQFVIFPGLQNVPIERCFSSKSSIDSSQPWKEEAAKSDDTDWPSTRYFIS